jgi:cardiolipin synthase
MKLYTRKRSKSKFRSRQPVAESWSLDRVFVDGDDFFGALERAIDDAVNSVDIESYIWRDDITGNRVFLALERAVKRKVSVRIVVDGFGSMGWVRAFGDRAVRAGILFKVYHALPWERVAPHILRGSRRERLVRLLLRLNNRNHRKLAIVDRRQAFVGSMNVVDDHVPSVRGASAWRDTGAVVDGPDVMVLVQSFEQVWLGSFNAFKQRLRRRRGRVQSSELVRLNVRRRQREDNYLGLLERIAQAKKRVWITNAYFVPDQSLLEVLELAAQRGVDVRVLVPSYSDVFFIPWIVAAFQYGLIKSGVKVYEYARSILHAKTIVIDNWALVGSSNLNHRSLLHDLEADVVITGEEAKEVLEKQFEVDLRHSQEVTLEEWCRRSRLTRLAGRVLLAFRYLL